MQMAEIIEFKKKIKDKSPVLEEIFTDPDVEMVTDAVLSASLDSLIRLGYNLEDNFDAILPSIVLLKETITSLQLKVRGTDHFLQEFAEKTFIITND